MPADSLSRCAPEVWRARVAAALASWNLRKFQRSLFNCHPSLQSEISLSVVHRHGVSSAQPMPLSTSPSGRRYDPIAQIGRGGMAEVLLTMVHAGGGVRRLEVLKRIWPELATEPDFVTMFLDEARLSLRLNHANVVQTYEVLAGDGQLAIAMEYLDGQPLTRVLNRLLRGPGALSLPLRLRILTSVLAGLEHAHTLTDLDGTALEVVHRDISPQNVFVTYDGQVKLVDFGVAKTLAASHHTRPGAIKGKLAYMAPEQFRCPDIDRRADLFSVGVMLWEMLAARRMWHGKTEVEIVGHLASGRPMPALPVPSDGSLPAGLDAICMRALDPDPDRRYQTAADLEMELEGVLVGAADSHARNLGKVVSLAFAAERAERRAVIDRCLARSAQQPAPAEVPSLALGGGLPETDISLADLAGEAPTASVPLAKPAPKALWLRRAGAVAGLSAAVATLLLAGDWRRAPAPDVRAGQGAGVAAAAPPAAEAASEPMPVRVAPAATVGSGRSPSARSAASAGASDEPEVHRRRHRVASADEDATLPPSDVIDSRP